MDLKDLAFIAQNSGAHAAALVTAAGDTAGKSAYDLLDDFTAIRKTIFEGALDLVGKDAASVQAEAEAAAVAAAERRVQNAFGGGNQSGGGSAPAPSGGKVKVRKQLEGEPIPDWLEKQVEWLIGKGDIDDADVIEVWDNRSYLPQFGGSRSEKAAWFTTVNKKAGEQYGQGIWPPKPRGGR